DLRLRARRARRGRLQAARRVGAARGAGPRGARDGGAGFTGRGLARLPGGHGRRGRAPRRGGGGIRTRRRRLFWLYLAVLFALTHWPNLNPQLPGRPDLLVHMSLFGGLTALLIYAGFFGPAV